MYKNITRLLRKLFLSCCLDLIQNLYIYNKIRTIWGDILDGKYKSLSFKSVYTFFYGD